MVNVPVEGGFMNVTFPETLYCCVNVSQAVGVALTAEILQITAQDGAAVKLVVMVQAGSSENTAVTVHGPPLAGNPVNE